MRFSYMKNVEFWFFCEDLMFEHTSVDLSIEVQCEVYEGF